MEIHALAGYSGRWPASCLGGKSEGRVVEAADGPWFWGLDRKTDDNGVSKKGRRSAPAVKRRRGPKPATSAFRVSTRP